MSGFLVECLPDIIPPVAHRHPALHPDTCFIEFLGHPGAVGIDGLSDQQFIADRDDAGFCFLGAHVPDNFKWRIEVCLCKGTTSEEPNGAAFIFA